VRGQLRFPHEIAHPFAPAQSSRSLDQCSHPPRLPVWVCRRKFAELDAVSRSGVNGCEQCVSAA
jgi:hypothetical protein